MPYVRGILAVAFFFALQAATSSSQGAQPASLAITIVPSKVEGGAAIIERDGLFHVTCTNRSQMPIRLWNEHCQVGHGTLSFRVQDEQGQPWSMHLEPMLASDWKDRPTRTITIPPGKAFSWPVYVSSGTGWQGVPEPNTGRPVTLTAVLDVPASAAAKEHGTWIGKVASSPLAVLFVEPNLKTPHDYLQYDCPKQALKLLEADRSWITKVDEFEQTPLHVAAERGLREVVSWLVKHGADLNARSGNQLTPLHLAKSPEMVQLLMDLGADVDAKNAFERTALEEAASNSAHRVSSPHFWHYREQWWQITRILLKAGADYDIRSACYLNDLERVLALVADPAEAKDKEAMRWAATFGHVKIVKLLLEHGADPEDAGYFGLTVSYFAIEHPEILRLLFAAGADPQVPVAYHGNGLGPRGTTLLHCAAEGGAVASAKLLVQLGLATNVADMRGRTPLHFASGEGHAQMVEWFLQNKADAKARTKDNETPLAAAVQHVRPGKDEDNARYQEVIRVFARAGVELDVFAAIACDDVPRIVALVQADAKVGTRQDAIGWPALHWAVAMDRRQITKHLLTKDCPPDVRNEGTPNSQGQTALHIAAYHDRLEQAELLIRQGASVNAKMHSGATPLHQTARLGHVELARLLLKHGANPRAEDVDGLTPAHWVRMHCKSPEMTELLREHGGDPKP